jgi:hypothetical protein
MWGVMSGGQKVWTVDNPFSDEGKGVEGPDERGNWVIGYVDPAAAKQKGVVGGAPTFNPSSRINQDMLKHKVAGPGWTPVNPVWIDSTDGKPWDPQQDKEMGHFSPMEAITNSSMNGLKWVQNMGPNAVAKAEREWYQDPTHWSPTIKAQGRGRGQAAGRHRGCRSGPEQRRHPEVARGHHARSRSRYRGRPRRSIRPVGPPPHGGTIEEYGKVTKGIEDT